MAHVAAKSSFFSRFFLSPLRQVAAARRDRRRVQELLHLSDAMLRDIGITRFDIQHAVRTTGCSSASARLAETARARCAANANVPYERLVLNQAA